VGGQILPFPKRPHARTSVSRKSSAETRPPLIDLKQAIKSQDGRHLPRRMRLMVLRSQEILQDFRTSEAICSSSSPRLVMKSDSCMGANVHEAHIAVKPACAWSGMDGAAEPVHDMHMPTSAKQKVRARPPVQVRYDATFMRAWREFRNKTLEEMAEKCGKTYSQLSKIETGKQPYSQQILEAYARHLGCSVIDLLARRPQDDETLLGMWPRLNHEAREMLLAAAKIATK
jgi:DNA-binding Xre family transcriptional regulator